MNCEHVIDELINQTRHARTDTSFLVFIVSLICGTSLLSRCLFENNWCVFYHGVNFEFSESTGSDEWEKLSSGERSPKKVSKQEVVKTLLNCTVYKKNFFRSLVLYFDLV